MYHITICNVTSSFSFGSSLNIKKIHETFPRSIFDKKVFGQNVVVLKTENPKMSFLIWKTGKIVCTGARSIDDAKRSADYLHDILRDAGINVKKKTEAKINNIVATTALGGEVALEKIMQNINKNSEIHIIYEPEQFPAAIIKIPVGEDTKVTILLFSTGKLVCVGSRNIENVKRAIRFLVSKMKETKSVT